MEPADHEDRARLAYDVVAEDYARLGEDWFDAIPWERAMFGVFAAAVRAAGGGQVVDAGCGPGRLTGHLAELGLDVSGIDLSPAMVEVARRTHPGLRFEVGSLAALDVADGALAGVVAWYSVIHTPPEHQLPIYRELRRVLRPGGHLLVGFQVGDECVHLEHAYGHDVSLDAHRLDPDLVERQLGEAGFEITARVLRGPVGPEPQRQAHLLARRPAAGS